jgi:hypothetical protein
MAGEVKDGRGEDGGRKDTWSMGRDVEGRRGWEVMWRKGGDVRFFYSRTGKLNTDASPILFQF